MGSLRLDPRGYRRRLAGRPISELGLRMRRAALAAESRQLTLRERHFVDCVADVLREREFAA